MTEQGINLEKEIGNLDIFATEEDVEEKPKKRQRKKTRPEAVVVETMEDLQFKSSQTVCGDTTNQQVVVAKKLDLLIASIDELNKNILSLINHEKGKHAHEMTTNEYLQNVDGAVEEVPVQLPKFEENLNEFTLPPIFIN